MYTGLEYVQGPRNLVANKLLDSNSNHASRRLPFLCPQRERVWDKSINATHQRLALGQHGLLMIIIKRFQDSSTFCPIFYWALPFEGFAMQSVEKFRKPPCNIAMGIEIECEISREIGYIFPERMPKGFWYRVYDGSLDVTSYDMVASEFVSQPLTPEWLKKEIVRLYKKTQWLRCFNAGIHIHVSRRWCSAEAAERINSFIKVATDEGFHMEWFGRSPNRYCMPSATNRYRSVNVENKATIEFRMFDQGDAAWACYCVDVACYLVKTNKRLNIDAMCAAVHLLKRQHGL